MLSTELLCNVGNMLPFLDCHVIVMLEVVLVCSFALFVKSKCNLFSDELVITRLLNRLLKWLVVPESRSGVFLFVVLVTSPICILIMQVG